MKSLEAQVQQQGSVMTDLHTQVDQLELGSNRNHEVIIAVDRKLDLAVNQIKENIGIQIREQLQGFMVMFARHHQLTISPDFPPRDTTGPILTGQGRSD